MITDYQRFSLSGWFSVVLAVAAIPIIIISIVSVFTGETKPIILYALLSIIHLAIYIYVLANFRILLHKIASFNRVDAYITLLIWINLIVTIASIITLPFSFLKQIYGIVSIVLMIPLGIIYAVFGVKLLKCEHDLFGYLKTFSYLSIATGILTASIILVFFSLLTSIAGNVILALIFFNGAKIQHKKLVL